jgi:hypothetical protein
MTLVQTVMFRELEQSNDPHALLMTLTRFAETVVVHVHSAIMLRPER